MRREGCGVKDVIVDIRLGNPYPLQAIQLEVTGTDISKKSAPLIAPNIYLHPQLLPLVLQYLGYAAALLVLGGFIA